MARFDLSALTVDELEEVAHLSLTQGDDAAKAYANERTRAHLFSPEAMRIRAEFGHRPMGWDHHGNA